LEIANGCWVWRGSHFISMLAVRLAEVHPKHDSNSMPAAMRKALLIIDQCPAPAAHGQPAKTSYRAIVGSSASAKAM